MPGPGFFRNLGLFVLDDFLDPGLCVQLCDEMTSSASNPGKVVLSNGEKLIDENVRRVLRAKVRRQNEDFVSRRLGALQPTLEEHFAVSLTASESPEFLVYNEGGFYA